MTNPNVKASWIKRAFGALCRGIAWLLLAIATLWALAALYFDLSFSRMPALTPIVYLVVIATAAYFAKRHYLKMAVFLAGFLIVLFCWLSLKPSNDRPWQPDDSQTPYAEINGDQVTIHNFRNCSYRTELDYTCEWLTKTVSLSNLRGIDLFVTYWGSPWIAHPIVSFQFGDNDHVAASIETRDQVGQGYSAVRGFFRQYALLYIFADERDVVRLRTNYRKDEDVHLFRTTAGPEWSRLLFLEYIKRANDLRVHPQWYNAATDNCTTNIFTQMAATGRLPSGSSLHDWWILLNGRAAEFLYLHDNFVTDNLPFPELMKRVYINPVARTVNDAPDFSRLVRVGRPGFNALGVPAQ
jgi:Domain of unknown function (DUF4105)